MNWYTNKFKEKERSGALVTAFFPIYVKECVLEWPGKKSGAVAVSRMYPPKYFSPQQQKNKDIFSNTNVERKIFAGVIVNIFG